MSTKGKGGPGTKKQDDEQTRERILKAALELFCRSGFEGVTISEIARQADAAQPIIYYYFKDKEALWKSAVAPAFERAMLRAADVQDLVDLKPSDRLSVSLRRYIKASVENLEVMKTMIHESASPGPRLDWLIETYLKPAHMATEFQLREAAPELDVPPVFVISLVVGWIHFFFGSRNLIKTIHDVDPHDPEVRNAFTDFCVSQVRHALKLD